MEALTTEQITARELFRKMTEDQQIKACYFLLLLVQDTEGIGTPHQALA